MIYLKTQIADNIEIKVDIYEDELFTLCPMCVKEMQVEFDELLDSLNRGGDLSSTVWYCEDCSPEILTKNK